MCYFTIKSFVENSIELRRSNFLRDRREESEDFNDDQLFCVEEASLWKRNGGPDYLVDVWLLAACCPKTAKRMRNHGLSGFRLSI